MDFRIKLIKTTLRTKERYLEIACYDKVSGNERKLDLEENIGTIY